MNIGFLANQTANFHTLVVWRIDPSHTAPNLFELSHHEKDFWTGDEIYYSKFDTDHFLKSKKRKSVSSQCTHGKSSLA